MARSPRNTESSEAPPEAPEGATATATLPQPAEPAPNGDQPTPQPAKTPRKKRSADSVRPIYLLLAMHSEHGTLRILQSAATIGRARKVLPDARYGLRDRENGPIIARCKMVS